MYSAYVQWICIVRMYSAYVQCICIVRMYSAYVQCICTVPMYSAYASDVCGCAFPVVWFAECVSCDSHLVLCDQEAVSVCRELVH